MCFTDAKKEMLLQEQNVQEEEVDVLDLVAKAWRTLSPRERAYWDEEARNDKVR